MCKPVQIPVLPTPLHLRMTCVTTMFRVRQLRFQRLIWLIELLYDFWELQCLDLKLGDFRARHTW
jgi:hypothetical protein